MTEGADAHVVHVVLLGLVEVPVGLGGVTEVLVGASEQVVEVVVLSTLQLAFAQMVGVAEALGEQRDGP